MPVYFDKDKSRWRFTFNRVINRVRHRASRLLPQGWNRTQAEAYERKQSAALYAQAAGIDQKQPLIDEAVALWLRHKMPSLRNGKKAGQELAKLIPWIQGRTFGQLAEVATSYAGDNPELSPATIRNRLSYLRAACRYAWKAHKLGDRNSPPGADMHLPTPDNGREVYHSGDDLRRLWAAFDDPEARALFQLAFFTGLRWRAEMLPRKPDDVVQDGGTWLRVPTTKNKAPRMVPIIPEAAPLLKYLPFTRHDRTYYAAFVRARAKAGLGHSVAHDLRHTLASAIISGQGTLSDVGAALGHRSVVASRRYAHLYPSHLRSVLESVAEKMHTAHQPKRRAAAKK